MYELNTLYAKNKDGSIQEWNVSAIGDVVYVTYGRMLGKKTPKITKAKPKNVGRANATTAEEQAIKEAQSKWTKQKDKGYFESIEEAEGTVVLLPMLANDYTKVGHRISYPCYVSQKLDGLRCVVFIEDSKAKLVSRGGKVYSLPHIEKQLLRLSRKTGFMRFDGEVYLHGVPLNVINSWTKRHQLDTEKLEFHIFDIPSDKPFKDRNEDLRAVHEELKSGEYPHLAVVLSNFVQDEAEARAVMDTYLADGYEGLMLRNVNGLYEWSSRSADLQKWKDFKDLEAQVLDVWEDKNQEGVLLCRYPETNMVFECKMKGDHAYRSYENMKTLITKWINVKYQTLTEYGVPQFPVGMYVRECDSDGCPLV